MFFRGLSPTYHSPITIDSLTYRVQLGAFSCSSTRIDGRRRRSFLPPHKKRAVLKPTGIIGLAPAAISHAQQTIFGSPVGPHPQPVPPAALASASRTQHAFALLGAGPPQHELVFVLVPVSLSVVAVFDISPPHSGEHSQLTRQG